MSGQSHMDFSKKSQKTIPENEKHHQTAKIRITQVGWYVTIFSTLYLHILQLPPSKDSFIRHWDHFQRIILDIHESCGRNRPQFFIRKSKHTAMHMMGKRDWSLSLKGTKWVSSRAESRTKESWLISYSIHEAFHSTAGNWYNRQPCHSSFKKYPFRMRDIQALMPFMTHSHSNSDVFHRIHHRNLNSCVFCLVHCNDFHFNACHASITVTTSNVLHPVLLQWLMLRHCTSLRISIMHHIKIILYSTGHLN